MFSINSMREVIAPGSTFTLITQNVDGLSRRALDEVLSKAGSVDQDIDKRPPMLEMHGRLFDILCTSYTCRHRQLDFSSPVCPALSGTENLVEAGSVEMDIPLNQLPRCSKCGALARPGVVWFGEQPQSLDHIDKLVARADLCLVVGTSSTVSIFRITLGRGLMLRRFIPLLGMQKRYKPTGGKLQSSILTEVMAMRTPTTSS